MSFIIKVAHLPLPIPSQHGFSSLLLSEQISDESEDTSKESPDTDELSDMVDSNEVDDRSC